MHPFALSRADDPAKAIAAHALDPATRLHRRRYRPDRADEGSCSASRASSGHQWLAGHGADRSAARRWPAHRGARQDERRGRRHGGAPAIPCRSPRRCCSPHPANCATWRRSAATSCSARAAPISATRPMAAATSGSRAPAARRLHGLNRNHAIFGWSESCVATNPSDLAVALAALDAIVIVRGQAANGAIPFTRFPSPARQHARA